MIAGIINNQRDVNRAHCHPAYGSVNKGSKIRAYEIWIMMTKNKDSGRYRRSSPTKISPGEALPIYRIVMNSIMHHMMDKRGRQCFKRVTVM